MHNKRKKRNVLQKMLFLILLIIPIVLFIIYKDTTNKPLYTKEKQGIETKEAEEREFSMFKKYYDKAKKLVDKMTIEEKIGQIFLVRYNANDVFFQKEYFPGGYILFAKDFENHTKESIKQEIEKDQKLSKYPLIMAVDEEGGYVTRVSKYKAFRKEKFQSPRYYFEQGGYDLLEEVETEKASMLKEIGINLNLAPVADVSINENDFIYNRSFGKNAKETAEYIEKMIGFANKNKINSCLKHFPGYGNNVDTHTGIAIDNRSYDTFLENDFIPFKSGIAAGVPSILVSHNIINSIDNEYPASLSEKVIKELRDNLGFTGIIMTDDLAMSAVKEYVNNHAAATRALNAGNDMIITSNFLDMYGELQQSLKDGSLTEETINKAVVRIIAWKYYSNLF